MLWGCEAPTPRPQLYIPCVRCRGQLEECDLCDGIGLEPIHRCPNSITTDETVAALELFAVFPKVLPRAGGLYDQTAIYVSAMRVLSAAKSRLEEIIRKADERRAQAVRHGGKS